MGTPNPRPPATPAPATTVPEKVVEVAKAVTSGVTSGITRVHNLVVGEMVSGSSTKYGLAVGAAAMIFWHAFINIGMVIGVLPVVGVTLPLVSYGGSSMVTKVMAIGFAVNAAVQSRRAA